MLIGSCCQPYQNLPIKIFINHPDARLCWFCSSSCFYHGGFFPTGQLPQVLQKLQTALKVHSQHGSDCAENLQEKLHSGNVHKPVWGWRRVRCKLLAKKTVFQEWYCLEIWNLPVYLMEPWTHSRPWLNWKRPSPTCRGHRTATPLRPPWQGDFLGCQHMQIEWLSCLWNA